MIRIIKQLQDTVVPHNVYIPLFIASALMSYIFFREGLKGEMNVSFVAFGILFVVVIAVGIYMYLFVRRYNLRVLKTIELIKEDPKEGLGYLKLYCEEIENELGEVDFTPERYQSFFPSDRLNNWYVGLVNVCDLLDNEIKKSAN